jgi:hypothetical protein
MIAFKATFSGDLNQKDYMDWGGFEPKKQQKATYLNSTNLMVNHDITKRHRKEERPKKQESKRS